MVKLINRVVRFAIYLVAGYIFFILLWALIMPDFLQKNLIYKIAGKGHMYSRMQEVKKVKDVDILFVGSSLAARGFDPRIFAKHGLKTFNMGSGGQTPLQTEWLLKKYVDQLNPHQIIFEVNPYVLSRDGIEPALDLISNHDFEWSMLGMIFTINNIKVYNTYIYSCWRKILGLNRGIREDKVKKEDTYIPGGFIEKEISYFRKEEMDHELSYSLKPVIYQQETLLRTLEFLKSKNIRVILIHPPVTHIGFDHYVDFYNVEEFFKKAGEYYNFNNYTELNDTLHFFDSRHLNQDGVELFNESVIQLLFDSLKTSQR